ncbi:hypothetical protein KW799_01355, partial [Candidatus Parcubacteria bacterium]|nr:hypothetical protein [Candidatus Parcubacteria bacterium]
GRIKIIGLAVLAILVVYAVFAFDIPYRKADTAGTGTPGAAGTNDMIRVSVPKSGDAIVSPVVVSGEARGTWFFEASFPIEVVAPDGTVLGRGIAQAQGDWMTPDFVSFTASIAFDPKSNVSGVIRLMKDNPSGLPQNDAHIDVPVSFKAIACHPTGCSGQICSDEDVASTCEYRPEYACYAKAKCERQSTGLCGWTATAELKACLTKS